ncbi:MAG: M6 family metalloprotease domain-containing protein [Prevotellaceae bacterium]|nr:M6 family metalloprotease domain-containing protein [Candidatus Minthosoma equi]
MKRFTLLFIIAMCAVATFAIPAKPGLRAVKQPDGTTLMVQLIGDEYFHYHATSDGLPLVKSESGAYVYANMLNDRFVATNVMAHDPSMRNAEELHVISQLQPVKMPESAKQQMQQNNKANAARAQARRKVGVPGQTKGKYRGLIILVDYPDARMSHTREEFDAMMNQKDYNLNGSVGSLSDYFYDQSYGQLKIDFDVVGPFTASKPLGYYGENSEEDKDIHIAELITEAVLMAHEAGTDFSKYDWAGDGNVDQVFVIYAGYAESYDAPDYTIWPHKHTLSAAQTQKNNGNGPILLDGVTVDTYACSSELNGNEGNDICGIGSAAHEFSHCLGLNDFYDTTAEGRGVGMGAWSLMDEGCFVQDGYVPCAYTSYERMFCGWLEPVELTEDTRIENMRPITETPEAYIIYNKANRNEYYLLENHQQSHNSDRYHAWDSGAYGHGMLVLHVDYDKQDWLSNSVNNNPRFQGMTIVPANDIFRYGRNLGEEILAGDLYPGNTGNTSLTNISEPKAQLSNPNSDGEKLMNAPIEDITEENGSISFRFGSKNLTDIPVLEEPANVDSTSFFASWSEVDYALSYTLEVTDLTPSPEYDPVPTTLYELDFTKMEPFASATENSAENISGNLAEYFDMEDWVGRNTYAAPQSIRIGSADDFGTIYTPLLYAPYDGKTTIEVGGVAEDNASTDSLEIWVINERSKVVRRTKMELDGNIHQLTLENIDHDYFLGYSIVNNYANIFYLSAQSLMPPPVSNADIYGPTEATSGNVTDLRPNGHYSYRVKATTLYGSTEWSEPKEVVLASPVSIANMQNTPLQPRTIYNLQGQLLSKPQRGISIIDGKKTVIR